MRRPLSRRRLLAAGVPGLLAGCLVESDGSADGDAGTGAEDDGSTPEDDGQSDDDGSATNDGDGSTAAQTDGGQSDTEQSEADRDSTDQTADEPVPDEVGPDGSGLVVTSAEVLDVTDEGYETTVDARLTVENRGRFTYGTVEFRADAYATRPNSPDRDSVGRAYVTRRFTSEDRFDDGTRRFDVSISFRSRETNVPADVDWYAVDAAVRTADPV
ncbi:hypothetical protein [Halorubrum depositum]|uniref:hypothetical protein n=1 Tax=Halorubrum depositum TaxID=2583992 RepID=UPI001642C43B|nr:hypothetical protein [Halorubrum depositum]